LGAGGGGGGDVFEDGDALDGAGEADLDLAGAGETSLGGPLDVKVEAVLMPLPWDRTGLLAMQTRPQIAVASSTACSENECRRSAKHASSTA
jgi:hypothetical protein